MTSGILLSRTVSAATTVAVDLQWQGVRSDFDEYYRNIYLSLKLQNWRNFNAALSMERSEDPALKNNFDPGKFVIWMPSANISYQASSNIDLQLFVGRRRGGTLCDYGFCVQVLDYEGAELRIQTRW